MSWFSKISKGLSKGVGAAITGGLGKLFGGSNSAADFLDPANAFHEGSAEREAERQWQLEYNLSKADFEESKAQNAWNRNMQERQFTYQQDLNALQMEREDTATQRRVADLKSAGLSPTLAAGSAAAAAPMHAGSVAQVSPAQHGIVPGNSRVEAAMFKNQMIKDELSLAVTMLGNFADISRTKAETELVKAQTQNVTAMTPIDLKLKEQAFAYADHANVYKLKGLALDVTEKEKSIDLKNYDLILAQDVHAQNALNYFNSSLDSRLKQADIDLKDREYILKSLAIDAATTSNAKLDLEYQNLMYDTGFYHTRGMPVGMNMGMAAPLFGAASWAHKAGSELGSATGDFVSRIYNAAKKSARKFTKGIFDFSQ